MNRVTLRTQCSEPQLAGFPLHKKGHFFGGALCERDELLGGAEMF